MLPRNAFRRIAPVGNPISLQTRDALPSLLDDARIRLVQSGTAALAAAVSVAKMAKPVQGKPEVIIPAYCCPDVVAAVVYNDCAPVLVDFIPDRPHMDLDAIRKAITANTIAVIAVNFLGIPERCKQIRDIIATHNILLIEDSAQWFPERGNLIDNYEGDLAIVSFGKGKPVSLLGGGAVICRNPALPLSQLVIDGPIQNRKAWQIRLLFLTYNLAINPLFYWILELMPFLKLGATRYKALERIAAMEPAKCRFLESNISAYQRRSQTLQENICSALTKLSPINLSVGTTWEQFNHQRLLRVPALLYNGDSPEGFALRALEDQGQGITKLYGNMLTDIQGMPTQPPNLASNTYPNATRFAKALVTLPTHTHARGLCSTLKKIEGR